MINQVKTYLLALQADICAQLEAVDTEATFIKDQGVKSKPPPNHQIGSSPSFSAKKSLKIPKGNIAVT
jgi:coproporphyrinogen III oxidase